MTDHSTQFIPVYILANRFEADVIMEALQQESIPTILQSFEETAYDGLFIPQRGWGRILVPKEYSSQALKLIQPLVEAGASGSLYKDPGQIDPLLWKKLEEADPKIICRNAQVSYNSEVSAYVVPFLDTVYHCLPHEKRMEIIGSTPYYEPYFEFYLVVLHYLLEAQQKALSGHWVSEKDLPGGHLFFQGPHVLPTDKLLKVFGARPNLFRGASEKIGGFKANMGDLSSIFWPLPRIPVLYILWIGDDEFDPVLHIRFDSTVNLHLHNLDVIWALVNVVSRHLRATGEILLEETSS